VESTDAYRLPTTVVPSHYRIHLRPSIDEARFDGTVVIQAAATEAVGSIVLNAVELDIDRATVHQGGRATDVDCSLDDERERLVLAGVEVEAGELRIEIAFRGTLNDKLRGFYRSSFTDDEGNEHAIATTQFEATNARRCFPCWDEPAIKAVFEVSLEVPDHMLAVSAMSETARTDLDDGWVRLDFAPTPIMSTYLLAFVVGELEASEPVDVDGVPLRIVHRPGRGDEIQFATDAAVFCLRWLTEYFGVSYYGDKLDLLAIPDFAFGAMENTGCVTFREVLLLVDPETTTQPEQQRCVQVIAHELAHMWFGNLVTMQWWEGLWLKEAFATFMETAATDAYRPDWKVWEGFALDRSAAYEVDSLHSTRAIEYEVHSPEDAEGMYDVLTYEKGASVVRMLEQFVGPDAFREGIRTYMATHAYGNTVTSDLWNAIASATRIPVGDIMRDWIYSGGFPLLDAAVLGDEIVIDQQPFRLLDRAGSADTEWKVPVTVASTSDAGTVTETVLMDPQGRIPLPDATATVVVDPDGHGFFRTRYDDRLAARLTRDLMRLSPPQRYRLFDDLFDLVLAGQATIGEFIALAAALESEASPPVWSTLSSAYATLAHVAPDRAARLAVGENWGRIAKPQLRELGFDMAPSESDPLVNEVRASLFGSVGAFGLDDEVVSHARGLFEGSIASTNTSMLSAAVRVVASIGARDDYDEIFRRYQAADSAQLERRYLFALARFDDAGAIADLCERSLDGSVRSQDAAFLLATAIANRWHGARVWQFVTDNWQAIIDRIPDNTVGRMLSGVEWLEHTDTDAVHAFLDAHDVPQARLTVDQHRERLEVHRRLAGRFTAEFARTA